MKIQIVIKGWYEKPNFNNRFEIDWNHDALPRIGEYIDIRPFRDEPNLEVVYRIDMVQWDDRITLCLLPIR